MVDSQRVEAVAAKLSILLKQDVKPLKDCVGGEVEAAVKEIKDSFEKGLIGDVNYEGYYNVKFMKSRKIDGGGVNY